MQIPKNELAQMVLQLCEQKKIKHVIISPGSRNAPLTIGFSNHSYFKTYSIVDERCAAFFALGIAQKLQEPTALVCTSGSALLNYYPAIAEAYYSDIPLAVLSADRPDYLVNIGDGQTINQNHVFENHILYSANLNYNMLDTKAFEYNQQEINLALDICERQRGPVHINLPFEEPLYGIINEFSITTETNSKPNKEEVQDDYAEYFELWKHSKRKLVLVGVNPPNTIEQRFLDILAHDESIVVFTETTSNIHHDTFFPSIDKIIAPLDKRGFEALQPEIILTFGGMIVSKKVKAFLREYKPKYHWHVDKKKANDTFFCLNKHFKCTVNHFFEQFLSKSPVQSDYKTYWNDVKIDRSHKHKAYLDNIPFCDLKAFESVLNTIPNGNNLQLGNSSTVRYAQLFDLNKTLHVYCNRGTSGIDGSTSTAIGSAIISKTPTVFITGDLSFFYDSNALWNNYIPNDFKIIVINNSGGGIFRILPGHKNTENFDTYFETHHLLTAEYLCKMYNIIYTTADSEDSLKSQLDEFYSNSNRPKLLEIFTPRKINDEILLNYFEFLKG